MASPHHGLFAAFALVLSSTAAPLGCHRARDQVVAMTGGEPERGAQSIRQYGCNSCHTIPGIPSSVATVGPTLEHVGSRLYLAGQIPNTPENLQTWIRHPQALRRGSVMPEMGVTAHDARDIAAYLYTLE